MRKRVVFLNFWPKGGMRHYSDSLVHVLVKENDVLYCSNYESFIPCQQQYVPLTMNPFDLKNYRSLLGMMRTIREYRPDIVHLNSGHPLLLVYYIFFSLFSSVATVHDGRSHEGESFIKKLVHGIQLFCFGLFFKKIVVHSEKIKNELPFFIARQKVHIMPIANHTFLSQGKLSRDQKRDDVLRILFFGRILEYKGLPYLVKAFDALDSSKYELTIAGEGLIDCDVKKEGIRVLNEFISDEKMIELFQEADVIALPYLSASQSGVAQLAFSFEKPVVATRVGAIPEAVLHEKNGLLINSGSVVELRDAIRRMSDRHFRQSLTDYIQKQNAVYHVVIADALRRIYG